MIGPGLCPGCTKQVHRKRFALAFIAFIGFIAFFKMSRPLNQFFTRDSKLPVTPNTGKYFLATQ